jgi:ABC-type multidrug transport system, ATPase component
LDILNASNLTKEYRAKVPGGIIRAADDVSFKVAEGEIVGFLGPNGAGKTTVIKMVTGLAAPSSGEVKIMGYSMAAEREKALRYVGGIIESPDFYLELSGYKNLEYLASLEPCAKGRGEAKKKRESNKKRVIDLLEMVGLAERKDDQVRKYSLGMKQRLGVAQALLGKPKLLVLDEPANGLDPEGMKNIRDLFKKLSRDFGMGIIISSHLLSEMQALCDRVIIIARGKIIAEKSIHELYGGPSHIIRTDRPEDAAAIIRKFSVECEVLPGAVRVKTADVAVLTKELVFGGISIFGVQAEGASLEDVYLSATKGK